MSQRKIFTALAASAVVALAGCDNGQAVQMDTEMISEAEIASGSLTDAFVSARYCSVTGDGVGQVPYSKVTYNFLRGEVTVNFQGWSRSFNTTADPAAQAKIRAAYALIPAAADCPAPALPPPATPGA